MIDLQQRRELFVDQFLIERLQDASLHLHEPQPANVALPFTRFWEGPFSGYPTVIRDGDLYRLYFRGWSRLYSSDPERPARAYLCYAESRDGISFHRPALTLQEIPRRRWHGPSNILLAGDIGVHSFSPFLDTRPGVPANERFKALAYAHPQGKPACCHAMVSADGVTWRDLVSDPVLTKGAFDSQNVAFWSEHEGCYVAYYRTWTDANPDNPTEYKGVRTISRSTSADFIHWSDPAAMDFGDAPMEELYTNQTQPYFRAPHIYIALPKRFVPGRNPLSPEEVNAFNLDEQFSHDVSDGVFMTSRGGNRYDRTFMEAFLRPGPDRANWASRTNMSALGVVPTGEREMSLYYQHRYACPSAYLMRYTLRLDGFTSVRAPWRGGEMITRPFTFTGSRLRLNYATSAAGGLRVEIQTPDGHPVPGFSLEDAADHLGDMIDGPIGWAHGEDVSALAGQPIRLRFVMRDADLYAMQFTAS